MPLGVVHRPDPAGTALRLAPLVPPTSPRPALRGLVFRGSTAVRDGLVSANDLRGPAWLRLFPDVYCDAALTVDHGLRVRAAVDLLVPGAVASGASAAVLWGLTDLAGDDDPVELTVPPRARRSACAGVSVRRRTLPTGAVTTRAGVPLTTAEVTALELAARLPLVEGVVLLDRFLDARVTRLDWLHDAAGGATGRGCRRARSALALADGLAGSPQETRLRLLLRAADVPTPVAQFEVRAHGRFLARTDFAWPQQRVALEYEGAWHTRQVATDRRRIEALQQAGWRVLFVTAADLHHPQQLLRRIREALAE